MADLLTSIRAEIEARMRELEPAIAEYERLSIAAGALLQERRSASPPARGAAPRSSAPAPRSAPVSRSRSARAPAKRRAPAKVTARAAPKRERPARSATGQAILAALEHGSHTLAELGTVTALPAAEIREALRQLRTRGAVVKTDRDGKAAYALPA